MSTRRRKRYEVGISRRDPIAKAILSGLVRTADAHAPAPKRPRHVVESGNVLRIFSPTAAAFARCANRQHAIKRISVVHGMTIAQAWEWLDHDDARAIEITVVLSTTCDPHRCVIWRRYH